jgi:hypothetical protein
MTDKEIIKLARTMRQAQKDYFNSRRHDDLQRSKQLERQLDQALEDWTNQNPTLLVDLFG